MLVLTPACGAVVELAEGNYMVYRAASGTIANHIGLKLDRATSISGLCVLKKEILSVNDTEIDERVNKTACRLIHARSLIVTPLLDKDKAIGVLKIISDKPDAFTELHIYVLQIMAGLIASGLRNQLLYKAQHALVQKRASSIKKLREHQKQLAHKAGHDPLTGLLNRSLFNKSLHKALSKSLGQKTLMALMYLDIDHFKLINDTFGHHIGDEVLSHFSTQLKYCLRTSDIVARLGGDEFVIIIEDLKEQEVACIIANKIIEQVSQKFTIQQHDLVITTSIGITFYHGKHEIKPLTLIKQADAALYQAKQSGRGIYKIF